jgi:hypothetical protein
MRRAASLAPLLALALFALHADHAPLAADEGPQRVAVVNFPDVQRVTGTVAIGAPIPQTRLETLTALVSPGRRTDAGSYTDAGTLDTAGFASVSLGVAGVVQGRLASPAPVGVLMLTDEPEIVATFRTHGIAQFALEVEAQATPAEPGIFHSAQVHFRLGFPRYRVLLYNASPRTSEVTVYAYLNNT